LSIDARCRITNPYHQAAGRLREILRGDAAHGTCGVGVGETVRHSLAKPDQTLRYADLLLPETVVLEKLHAQRETLLAELHTGSGDELQVLQDEALALLWLRTARALARQCPPATIKSLTQQLQQRGAVIFEGAQGILLDEWRGFHPHTTWSSTTPLALENALAGLGLELPVEHFGVLRTYLTRHGTGPMPTHDAALDPQLPEPHNHAKGWQGRFRRGHPDAVLLRYALECAPNLSGLFVSHMDVFEKGVTLKWCSGYHGTQKLQIGTLGDLEHQARVTRQLFAATPNYLDASISSGAIFRGFVESLTSLPVILHSVGKTSAHVQGTT
jgi:adenylosuccinate synthase